MQKENGCARLLRVCSTRLWGGEREGVGFGETAEGQLGLSWKFLQKNSMQRTAA
mgnify:CR=1 FL=1